jgi:hypothetical protein
MIKSPWHPIESTPEVANTSSFFMYAMSVTPSLCAAMLHSLIPHLSNCMRVRFYMRDSLHEKINSITIKPSADPATTMSRLHKHKQLTLRPTYPLYSIARVLDCITSKFPPMTCLIGIQGVQNRDCMYMEAHQRNYIQTIWGI